MSKISFLGWSLSLKKNGAGALSSGQDIAYFVLGSQAGGPIHWGTQG